MDSRAGCFPAGTLRLAMLLLLLGWTGAGYAATFYVRTAGNDANDGLTPATAFASIRHAAASLINAGDQVVVAPGTYTEGDISPAQSGIPNRPVSFSADTMGTHTGDPAGPVIIMPPADQTTGFTLLGRHDIVIDGFTIVGAADAGIQVGRDVGNAVNSRAISVTNNTVSNSAKRGIDVSVDGSAHVAGNVASDNGSSGITVQGEAGSNASADVSGNTVTANHGPGIVVQRVRSGAIDGNTISESVATGLQIRGSTGLSMSQNVLRNGKNGAIGIDIGAVAPGDCNGDGTVSVDELLVGVDIILGAQPIAACSAFDPYADGTVTIPTLVSAINAALGASGALELGSDYLIADNAIENNGKFGIAVNATGSVTVQGNQVLHSGTSAVSVQLTGPAAAVAAATVSVTENTLGASAVHGAFLTGMQHGLVQNNVVFSNADTGITVRAASNVQIANNLIYANGSHGVALGSGGAGDATADATVVNNTLYMNGQYGLAVGNDLVASPGTLVANNIFNLNAGGGIGFQRLSADAGYVTGFNLNTDGIGPDTRASVTDFNSDPLFVNPPGSDGVLGGDGFVDDDFRLLTSANPAQRSPAIDAGSGPASAVGITGSALDSGASDTGTVDVGYHYGASSTQMITITTADLFMPIYVRTQGDAGNNGLSPEHALSSIRAAGLRASSATTIIVGPGRYSEGDIRVKDLARNVKFLADPSGAMTGDPPGIVMVDATGLGKDTVFVLVDGPGAVIDGFYVTGSKVAGIQIHTGSDGAVIENNVVFSNVRSGIESVGANDVQVQNNLVYGNGTGGIRVAEGSNCAMINNTAYGNGAVGILAGGGEGLTPTLGTVVMRNISQGNQKGILATDSALDGYMTGFNVSLDGFEGHTPRADSDFVADALFVNPAGADGMLGGAGFADDDFHLIQGGVTTSPAVDIDFTTSDTLTAGSTRSDGAPDTGPDDAGYHYPVK